MALNRCDDPFTNVDAPALNEIIVVIRKLRNRRAPGEDKIPPELLKYAKVAIGTALHFLFQAVWTTGKVPVEWGDEIIVSLYKGKGSRSDCCSCRPRYIIMIKSSWSCCCRHKHSFI